MSEPNRWRADGPERVRELLRDSKDLVPRDISDGERERVGRRVMRMAAVPAGLGILFWMKGLALGAGLGAMGVVTVVSVREGWIGGRHETQLSPPAPVPTMVASGVALPSALGPIPTAPPSASEAGASVQSPVVSLPPAAPAEVDAGADAYVDLLAEEASMLEQARAAIATNPSRALELAQRHAARFPTGQLGMEREIVAIEALRAMGRGAEARGRAESALVRARGGFYEERIRNLLTAMP